MSVAQSRKTWLFTAMAASLLGGLFVNTGAAEPQKTALVKTDAAPAASSASATKSDAPFQVFPPDVNLETSRDYQNLIVKITRADGVTRDVTAEAKFSVSDSKLATIEGSTVRPAGDGSGHVKVTYNGKSVEVPLAVKQATTDRPISFRLDVMPVFMKGGCNVGGCHGSARGKDGFMLSLFGYDADGDY